MKKGESKNKILAALFGDKCCVSDCENKLSSRGLCNSHKAKLIRHNNPFFDGRVARHGKRNSFEYSPWLGAKQRCFNVSNKKYKNYGGRGIVMCAGWKSSFLKFLEDMGTRPKGTSLDRIDNNGNYSCGNCKECIKFNWPMNCRWADDFQQANNRRDNKLVTHDGKTMTLSEWDRVLGFRVGTLGQRIETYNWSIEKAIETTVSYSSKERANNG